MKRRGLVALLVFSALLAAAIALRLLIGPDGLGIPADGLDFRVRRAVAGVIAGAALSLAGVMLQCLLRNPLASPDLLGLASGAGLGVMTAAYIAYLAGEAMTTMVGGRLSAGAMVGATGVLGLIYLLSQRRGLIDPVSLVLVGVVMSLICGALTVLVQQLMPPNVAMPTTRWMLGSLSDDTTLRQLGSIGAVVVACLAYGAWAGSAMDAASLGEDEARSVGVNLTALRAGLFVCSGVLAASAVVLAGPIGFVGLVCPHVARMLGGPGHRWLVVNAALAGAALVVLADVLVKAIELPTGRIPISVVTALVGGPFFIWLLRQRQRGEV